MTREDCAVATRVTMPKLGLTFRKGKVVRWLKTEGELVNKGEPLVEVMTEKVTVVVEAPATGILAKIVAPPGAEVPLGGLLAVIAEPGEDIAALTAEGKPEIMASAQAAGGFPPVQEPRSQLAASVPASPAARRRARELGLSPEELVRIPGTGPGGRITEGDVERYASTRQPAPRATPLARRMAEALDIPLSTVRGSGPHGKITKRDLAERDLSSEQEQPAPAETTLAPTPMRTTIAARMTASWREAPQVTFTRLVDAGGLLEVRAELKAAGVRVTVTDFVIKAVARTLRDHPRLRAHVVKPEGEIRVGDEINVGIAVAVPDGLLVPVLRRADRLGLAGVARRTRELVARAREGALRPEEITGGVFTVSNLGMYGVDFFTAIPNPPETAILAVGRIFEAPVVVDREIRVRPAMYLTLTVDHRAVNGDEAAKFLGDLCARLERPLALLLEEGEE